MATAFCSAAAQPVLHSPPEAFTRNLAQKRGCGQTGRATAALPLGHGALTARQGRGGEG